MKLGECVQPLRLAEEVQQFSQVLQMSHIDARGVLILDRYEYFHCSM